MFICVPFSDVTYIDFIEGAIFLVNRTINALPRLPAKIHKNPDNACIKCKCLIICIYWIFSSLKIPSKIHTRCLILSGHSWCCFQICWKENKTIWFFNLWIDINDFCFSCLKQTRLPYIKNKWPNACSLYIKRTLENTAVLQLV